MIIVMLYEQNIPFSWTINSTNSSTFYVPLGLTDTIIGMLFQSETDIVDCDFSVGNDATSTFVNSVFITKTIRITCTRNLLVISFSKLGLCSLRTYLSWCFRQYPNLVFFLNNQARLVRYDNGCLVLAWSE